MFQESWKPVLTALGKLGMFYRLEVMQELLDPTM